jgi:hypothetical protein
MRVPPSSHLCVVHGRLSFDPSFRRIHMMRAEIIHQALPVRGRSGRLENLEGPLQHPCFINLRDDTV